MSTPHTYTNRHGDTFTFTFTPNGDVVMEGDFTFCRVGFKNDYTRAYQTYVNDANDPITLSRFKEVVHGDGFPPKYRLLVESTQELNMVDPSGGPFLALGMDATMVHPEAKGKVIGKILDTKESFTFVLIEKGKEEQRQLLRELMHDDETSGLYNE